MLAELKCIDLSHLTVRKLTTRHLQLKETGCHSGLGYPGLRPQQSAQLSACLLSHSPWEKIEILWEKTRFQIQGAVYCSYCHYCSVLNIISTQGFQPEGHLP